jgi:hypothetical protein
MAALVRNYTIERGVPFSRQITFTEITGALDLTGVTAAAYVRTSQMPTDIRAFAFGEGPKITEFEVVIADPTTDGVLTISLTSEDTLLLLRGAYDYDVILTFPGNEEEPETKRRVLMGILTAIEVVTREDVVV